MALDACAAGPIRVVSLCAGDGRDLIGVLENHPSAGDVQAHLVEMNPNLVARGNEAAAHFGLTHNVHFYCADAALADSYRSFVPAEIVMICGVFGNVRREQVERLIFHLDGLCSEIATVIWTRNVSHWAGEHAATHIRKTLQRVGFCHQALVYTIPKGFAVGRYRFRGTHRAFKAGERLFEFVGYDKVNALPGEDL